MDDSCWNDSSLGILAPWNCTAVACVNQTDCAFSAFGVELPRATCVKNTDMFPMYSRQRFVKFCVCDQKTGLVGPECELETASTVVFRWLRFGIIAVELFHLFMGCLTLVQARSHRVLKFRPLWMSLVLALCGIVTHLIWNLAYVLSGVGSISRSSQESLYQGMTVLIPLTTMFLLLEALITSFTWLEVLQARKSSWGLAGRLGLRSTQGVVLFGLALLVPMALFYLRGQLDRAFVASLPFLVLTAVTYIVVLVKVNMVYRSVEGVETAGLTFQADRLSRHSNDASMPPPATSLRVTSAHSLRAPRAVSSREGMVEFDLADVGPDGTRPSRLGAMEGGVAGFKTSPREDGKRHNAQLGSGAKPGSPRPGPVRGGRAVDGEQGNDLVEDDEEEEEEEEMDDGADNLDDVSVWACLPCWSAQFAALPPSLRLDRAPSDETPKPMPLSMSAPGPARQGQPPESADLGHTDSSETIPSSASVASRMLARSSSFIMRKRRKQTSLLLQSLEHISLAAITMNLALGLLLVGGTGIFFMFNKLGASETRGALLFCVALGVLFVHSSVVRYVRSAFLATLMYRRNRLQELLDLPDSIDSIESGRSRAQMSAHRGSKRPPSSPAPRSKTKRWPTL